MNNIFFVFILFFIYSFIGWIIEVVNCSFILKRFVMRGFLIGPYCPIYGTSALLMILFLEKYSNDLFVLFVMSSFIATFIEYITSYIMEILFKVRWWDYSEKKFNINGRVCLSNSMWFGILGVILILFINPFIENILFGININILQILSISLIFIILIDVIFSYFIISNLKLDIDNIYKDYTEIIDKKVWDLVKSSSFYKRRILNSFPKLKIRKFK